MPSRGLLDQRGVALPMALFTLTLLTTLMLAFASLSQTEPVIAANHFRGTQARTLAESGLELALWALTNPGHPAGVPTPLPGEAAQAPFDGRTFVPLGAGGFTVRITNHSGGDPNRRTLTAVGWLPTNSPTDSRPRAHRQITVDAVVIPPLPDRAPCALCVRGALDVTGSVAIDARNPDAACGDDARYGAFTRDAITLTGAVALAGGAGPSAQHQPAASFEEITLSAAALDALKTLAWRNGTYYGPGFPRGGLTSDGGRTWTARIVFDAANPLPDGVVFVDTTDGLNLTGEGQTATTLAGARLDAGALAAQGGVFRGWIVVNGSLEVTGSVSVQGVLYTVGGLTYTATGESRLQGLAVALNAGDATATRVAATGGGSLTLSFDCARARAAGVIPRAFTPIPGTYREVTD